MARAIAHRQTLTPAGWRALAVGLMAALALCIQSGAALAHTHAVAPETVAADMQAVVMLAQDQGDSGQPGLPDAGTQCPLCHSPLGHGGLIVPVETTLVSGVHYCADNALPPAQAPPAVTEAPRPPARAPPQSI